MKRWGALGVVGALALVGWLVVAGLGDPERLIIPVGDLAPGAVRLHQGLWVARQPGGEFFVYLDRDPHRGQALNWVEAKGLFMQAAYYRLDGSCQGGPCTPGPGLGLYRVESRLEGESLVVFPEKVIAGGIRGEAAWLFHLKHLLERWGGG